LLPQMNESSGIRGSPDVIVVSVSCDRDHALAGPYEPAEYSGQRAIPVPASTTRSALDPRT
jgi:hypothetical protein